MSRSERATRDLPVVVEAEGGGWHARPVGGSPSSAMLAHWRDDAPLPEGYRLSRGPGLDRAAMTRLGMIERPIDVDQTNSSVIVADAVVVKWMTEPLVGPHPAAERLRRLVDAGFDQMPALWGILEWRTPAGDWVPVVLATDLVDASDGWTWCLHEARVALGLAPGPAREFGRDLGMLVGRMHLALAEGPTGPVFDHGDLHVGQILRDDEGRLHVIDFDGNPTLSPADRMAPRPAAYDVAGMLLSLENVGHVVGNKYHPEVADSRIRAWTERVQAEFLDGYRSISAHLLDESLLAPYVDDQIQRELAYADAHLPAWRYVPEAALRRRGRL